MSGAEGVGVSGFVTLWLRLRSAAGKGVGSSIYYLRSIYSLR